MVTVDPAAAVVHPWVLYCDGSAAPNPGYMGLGAIMTAPDGTRHTLSQATHTRGCNNEAELLALMAALHAVQVRGAKMLQIFTDNSLLVEQLAGPSVPPVPPVVRLASLFDEVRALLGTFEHASLKWIPRHRNGEADALARAALGLLPKSAVKPSKKKRA